MLAAWITPAEAAAKSCGRQILDDWSDGRIDATYPLRCYAEALELAPRDLLDYSTLEDDIDRALTAATRGKLAGPYRVPVVAVPQQPDERRVLPKRVTTTAGTEDPVPTAPEAAPQLADSESASAVPLPLLVLAGLGLLLVAGGSAGYLFRRYRGGDVPPPAI